MKEIKDKAKTINLGKVEAISPQKLYLDYKNPRLTGMGYSAENQLEILKTLWKDKEVSEKLLVIRSSRL